MAKSKYKYEWYYGAHSCGHNGKKKIGGFSEEYRQGLADDYFNGLCDDCAKIAREKENEERNRIALSEAKEANLLELEGATKQVAWAITIRKDFIDRFAEASVVVDEMLEELRLKPIQLVHRIASLEAKMDKILKGFNEFIGKVDKASVYIDARWILKYNGVEFLETLYSFLQDRTIFTKEQEEQAATEAEVKKDAIIYPENYNGLDVEIQLKDEKIRVVSPKDEGIMRIVKSFEYRWYQRAWVKWLGVTTGSNEDRVVELSTHLLNAGYGVLCLEVERERILSGQYEPETDRWILRSSDDTVKVIWNGFSDELYDNAKRIRTAEWKKGAMRVNIGAWKEIEDFADINYFKISDKVKMMIREQQQRELTSKKSKVSQPKKVQRPDKLKQILESPADVLEDLKD